MPGNMNKRAQTLLVRPDRQGPRQFRIAAQEIETPDGQVKRYARAEDITAAAGAAPPRRRPHRRSRCRHGCGRRRRRKPPPSSLLRPSDPAEDDRPSRPDGRIRSQLRAPRAAARHAGAPAAAIPARHRRASAAATPRWHYLARNADGLDRRRPRDAGGKRAGPDRGPRASRAVFAAGSRAEVSIVGRLERPGRPPALVSGPDRPAGGERQRGPDRRFQDQPRPADSCRPRRPQAYVRQLALYRAVLRSFIPTCRSAPRCSGPKRLN